MKYTDLDVFKGAHNLVLATYRIIKNFPKEENFRVVDQLIRSAYSVPSNIAEGSSRNTTKDYVNFLYISRGSLNEYQYYLLLAKDLRYVTGDQYFECYNLSALVALKLNALIKSLRNKLL